jgi:hypothetical protein
MCGVYVAGFNMSPFAHVTFFDQEGVSGEDVTEDHIGSPERLGVR